MEVLYDFLADVLDLEEFLQVFCEAFAIIIFAFALEVKTGDKIFGLHLCFLLRVVN